MPHLHVALINERPEMSLLPILQLCPQRIMLIPCQSSPQAAERLAILLRHELPPGTEIETHASFPSGELNRCAEYAFELANALYRQQSATPSLSVTLDVGSCSTLTALLFQQALKRCSADWLYADTPAGALYRLAGNGAYCAPEAITIDALLDVDRYLQANGRKRVRALSDSAEWQAACAKRRHLTQYLAHHAEHLAGLLGELNAIVNGPKGVLAKALPGAEARLQPDAGPTLLRTSPRFPDTDALVALHEAGMLNWSSDTPQAVAIGSTEAARYLGGGWLTEYIWLSAQEARLSQVCSGVHILDLNLERNDRPVIPACLAVDRNQLLFVECFIAEPGADACIEQGLKRLHGLLNHSAGLSATRVLLACGEFDKARQRLTDLQRLQGLQVEVVECGELKQLPTLLKGWKEHGQWPER